METKSVNLAEYVPAVDDTGMILREGEYLFLKNISSKYEVLYKFSGVKRRMEEDSGGNLVVGNRRRRGKFGNFNDYLVNLVGEQ